MPNSLLTPEIKSFIEERGDCSADEVALLAPKYPELPIPFIARQIAGRKRVKSKLPSWHENPDTVFPQTLSLEQCSSERAAQYKAGLVNGKICADLTGGFGVDARFMADRVEKLFFCEKDEELAAIVESNFAAFGISDKVDCQACDGVKWQREYEAKLDFIYIDPARRDSRSFKISKLSECEPDPLAIWHELLGKADRVMLKASPGLDVDQALRELDHVEAVHVVSVQGECKELLLIGNDSFGGEATIVCVDLLADGSVARHEFLRSEEKEMEGSYALYERYLYEPNASIMKAGGFKTFGSKIGLPLLNPRTRYYTSKEFIEDFPGRVFWVEKEGELNRKSARELFPEGKANVVARNAGMSTAELKAKLKLKDGGEAFAIGCRDASTYRLLLRCKRVK